MTQPRIFQSGDAALVCEAPAPATLDCQRRVWAAAEAARGWPHVLEVVPGMNNLTIMFDPLEADRAALTRMLETALDTPGGAPSPRPGGENPGAGRRRIRPCPAGGGEPHRAVGERGGRASY